MQLATIGEQGLWMCNVYFVADENNNVYWSSSRIRQHSKEIITDSRVAATIVHNEKLKQAIQISGDAFEVPLEDAERISQLYALKFGDKPSRLEEVLANTPDGRAFWVLKPKIISLWDEVNFPENPKQKIL